VKPLSGLRKENRSLWQLKLPGLVLVLSLLLSWTASAVQSQELTPIPLNRMMQVKVVEAEADSFVYYDYHDPNSQRDNNFGRYSYLQIGRLKDPVYYPWQMAYVRFRIDLTDLPPSAVITSAWAQLYYSGKSDARGVYNLDYGLASPDWDEYKITYNNQPNQMFFINTPPSPFNADQAGWVNILNFVDQGPEWLKNGVSLTSLWVGVMEGDEYTAYFSSREGDHPPHILISYYIPTIVTPTPARRPRVTPTPTEAQIAGINPVQPDHPFGPVTTPTPCPLVGCQVPWYVVGPIILLAVGILGYWLFRPRKPSGGQREPPDGNKSDEPIIPPVLPPLRLLRFWLTQTNPGGELPVNDNTALAAGSAYNLNVQIQVPTAEQAGVGQPGARSIPLDLVLYSPESDFRVQQRRAVLEIPASGSSARISIPIRAQEAGVRRLRLCIYYQNTLLQSGVLEAAVNARSASGGEGMGGQVTRQLDYVASPYLTQLGASPRPALNIFTNETSEGTHWVGVYSSEPEAGESMRQGQLFVFEANHLAHLAEMERQSLSEVQEERGSQLDWPLPLDERSLAKLGQDLISLAIEGFRLYNDLFLDDPSGLGMDTLRKFDAVLRTPGIISIARCRGSSTSLPWAGLYTFPLQVDRPRDLRLCDIFKQELLANRWTGRTALNPIRDHLDTPGECLSQAGCPVRAAGDRQTVCPFGFWGWLHQIEQPLQQIKPTPVDSIPDWLRKRNFTQDGVLLWKAQQKLRCAVAVNRQFVMEDEVYARVQSTVPAQKLEIERTADASRILELIKGGGRHFYYFICHGVIRDDIFQLEFSPGAISSAGLYPFDMNWPEQPKPLFILNACESSATRPDLIHGFLEKLRLLGVSGVVGTEIPVAVGLAIPFGSQLMYYMLTGSSIGEAFLKLRSHLLRQGNPLGLLYSFYAPADLHLHPEGNCAWCRSHGIN
jgi:hypothetical protein